MQQRMQKTLAQEPFVWADFPEALDRPGRHLREAAQKHERICTKKTCGYNPPRSTGLTLEIGLKKET